LKLEEVKMKKCRVKLSGLAQNAIHGMCVLFEVFVGFLSFDGVSCNSFENCSGTQIGRNFDIGNTCSIDFVLGIPT
jgi:hypothetical protein